MCGPVVSKESTSYILLNRTTDVVGSSLAFASSLTGWEKDVLPHDFLNVASDIGDCVLLRSRADHRVFFASTQDPGPGS